MSRDPSLPSVSATGCRPDVLAHVERHLGPVTQLFRENGIDVLCVRSAVDRPVHTLVTAGVSETSMDTGGKKNAPERIELMMTLPEGWKLKELAASDPEYWPIRLLGQLGALPRDAARVIGWGDTIPNGTPPVPYVKGSALCGVIIAPSLLVPKEFYTLDVARQHIEFYAAIPLYREELAAREQHGMEFLLTKLLEHQVSDRVDLKRRNVMKKRFGFF